MNDKPENRFQNIVEFVEDNKEEIEKEAYVRGNRRAVRLLVAYNRLNRKLTGENLDLAEAAMGSYIETSIKRIK